MLVMNIVLSMLLIASSVCGSGFQEYKEFPKIRRGSMTLYPFPRVGRSQNDRTWLVPLNDYADSHNDMKRAYLVPFPRVGRAMSDGNLPNGDGPAGMWFGPRLGRVSKRSFEKSNEEIPWNMIDLKDSIEGHSDDEQVDPAENQTPRQNVDPQ